MRSELLWIGVCFVLGVSATVGVLAFYIVTQH